MPFLINRGDYVKIINIDVIKQTYGVSPVEGDVNVIKVKFINTPSEWIDDDYGVYALFTKDNDSEIMKVAKDTWECDIPNRMVAVNSGVKVILYAMNSDTTNPKRWVIDPVWVAISEGLDNSYNVTATSGLNKDNMDALSTLIQVISSYEDAEAKRDEAEEKRAEAEIKRQSMVKDLGSFETADAYNEAIDNAKESGLYKAQYTDGEKVIPVLFLVISGVNHDGKELVYQMQLRGSYLDSNETCIPLMRVYADGAWSDSNYQFESSYYKNSNIIDNANSEEMYPTNKGVSDYVFNAVIGGAPAKLSTLGMLAAAIGNDEQFAKTVTDEVSDLKEKTQGFGNAISDHVANSKNPHQVTKNQLGLGNVDDTSDEDKPLSNAAREALGTKLDKSNIVTDYNEWFETADEADFDTKVPSIGIISKFFEESGYLSERNINAEINPDAEAESYTHYDIPNVGAVINYVDAQMNRAPEHELPSVLKPNTEYNLGHITDAVLLFPEDAHDGDVIYVVFTAGTPYDNVVIAINIDFTSGLEDFEPEPGKKYEIYGKYDVRDAIWLCGYSEY